jgi:AGCS family alanine or glycine:cation symporter
MILSTGKYNVYNPDGGFIVENLPGAEIGPAYTQAAVDTLLPNFGSAFVAIALFFFAFSTIMAYYYIAETNIAYLFRKGSTNRHIVINLLRIFLIGSTFYGAIRTAALAWGLGDLGVGIMAWLNVIAILILGNIGIKVLKDWEEQKAMGRNIDTFTFEPKKLDIKNADYWIEVNKRKADRDSVVS